MASKPERISMATYFISLLFLAICAVTYLTNDSGKRVEVVLTVLAIAAIICTAELWNYRIAYFLGLMSAHMGVTFLFIGISGPLFPIARMMIVISLIANVSLRLPSKYSVPAITAALVLPPVIVFTSAPWSIQELSVLCIEAVFAVFLERFVYYRETLVANDITITNQRKSLTNLASANASFVEHLPEMREESAEKERLRITRELHDSLGYAMTNIVSIMNAAQYLIEENPEKVREFCAETKQMAAGTMEETRSTLYKLRAIGQNLPGNPSIFFDKLCRDFQEATGIITECHPGNLVQTISERVFKVLFRTVQVGFINALKHGKAGRIRLHTWIGDENLRLTIWNSVENPDFDKEELNEGIGLKGIRERLSIIGGELRTIRSPDGFNLSITVPAKELYHGTHSDFNS